MRYGREISAAVDPLDLGWPAVAVRAGVGLVYSVLIEEVVTPRSVGGRTGALLKNPSPTHLPHPQNLHRPGAPVRPSTERGVAASSIITEHGTRAPLQP